MIRFKASAVLFAGLLLFSGCSPIQRLSRLIEKHPGLIDTVRVTTTIYRDTIINVPVLGTDTVTVYGTIRDTVYASSGTAHARTYIKRDTVYLNVWQSDTLLKVKCDSLIKEVNSRQTEIVTVQKECKKTKIDRYLNKFVIIALIVLAIFFLRLFKK